MATFHVDGFAWEATFSTDARMARRAEAEAALDSLPPLARSTNFARKAQAAFEVADYTRVIDCCDAATEAASPERWT